MNPYIQKLRDHFAQSQTMRNDWEAASILDLFYLLYSEAFPIDNEKIHTLFTQLDGCLEPLSFDQNNQVFSFVCEICRETEKQAFLEGLRIGFLLSAELENPPV